MTYTRTLSDRKWHEYAMKNSDLKVDTCYRTKAGQVRRILKIEVTYEARGKKPVPRPWPVKKTSRIDRFLKAVVEEVSCNADLR